MTILTKPQARDGLFDFEWSVDAAGYELVEVPFTGAPGGTAAELHGESGARLQIVRKGGALKPYKPRDTPDLHRRFAALDGSPDSLLAFVAEFGFLGINTLPNDRVTSIKSEDVESLVSHHSHVAEALSTFDGIAKLERRARRIEGEMEEEGRAEDYPAAEYLRHVITHLFNEWSSPRLTVRLVRNPSGTSAGLSYVIVPRTLYGGMWLQVGEELTGGARFAQCRWCHKPMPIGKGAGRADKQTCSDACRQALSKHNRKSKQREATL